MGYNTNMERSIEVGTYSNIRFVSRHPHDNAILAKLGAKVDGCSVGVGTSFEGMSSADAYKDFAEFMSRHEGEDWVMRFDIDKK